MLWLDQEVRMQTRYTSCTPIASLTISLDTHPLLQAGSSHTWFASGCPHHRPWSMESMRSMSSAHNPSRMLLYCKLQFLRLQGKVTFVLFSLDHISKTLLNATSTVSTAPG